MVRRRQRGTERERERLRERKRESECERASESETERGRYKLYAGTYWLRHKLFSSPFCCSCLHISLTYLFTSASPSQASKRRTENKLPILVWPLTPGSLSAADRQGPVEGSAWMYRTDQLLQKTDKSDHLTQLWQDFLGPAAVSCFYIQVTCVHLGVSFKV